MFRALPTALDVRCHHQDWEAGYANNVRKQTLQEHVSTTTEQLDDWMVLELFFSAMDSQDSQTIQPSEGWWGLGRGKAVKTKQEDSKKSRL